MSPEKTADARGRSRMGRVLLAGALGFAVQAACRTAGGPAPATTPDPLADTVRALVGQPRIFRFDGKKKSVSLEVQDLRGQSGPCDVAVEVKSAEFNGGLARFSLEPIGQPRLDGQRRAKRGKKSPCEEFPAETSLLISGLGGSSPERLASEVGRILLTVEDYLQTQGVRFDRPAGADPKEVADPAPNASADEQRLARTITAGHHLLLAIDPVYRSPNRKVRYQGQVEFVAVVGTDGRLHKPRLTTSLGDHEERVLRVLPLWRYEPARRGEPPVALRLSERAIFRIF